MSRGISGVSREHFGGHGLPESMSQELRQIIQQKWDGSLMKFAQSSGIGYYTVYSILVQGGGKASLELIHLLSLGLGCSKSEIANALKKSTPEKRKSALLKLCDAAQIGITELSQRCFGNKTYMHKVINSNKRTQNFLKVVDALDLDVERFEEIYKSDQFAA